MEKSKTSTVHILLMMGTLVIALAFRLIRAGILPLNNMEAEIALQALGVARGINTRFGPHIAYVGLTGFDFFLFNASNFLARFWPGLVGALIVFVPYLFRDTIGRWPAIITSFILAISPEMVGLSRIIGSPMMAYVFLLLALGFYYNRRPVLTGLCLALGLMSGPGFWMGSFIIGLSILISNKLFNGFKAFSSSPIADKKPFWLRLGVSFGTVLLVVGTGFFLAPAAISGIFSGLLMFLKGFVTPSTVPLVLLPLTLFAYTSGAVFLGFWGSLKALIEKNKLDLFLLVWWVFGLIFLLVYPSAGPEDFIWVTFPLWLLSGRVLFSAWHSPKNSIIVVILTAGMVVVVSAFMLLTLRSLINLNLDQNQQLSHFIALIGGALLMFALTLLVRFGWSEDVALPGFIAGLAIVICVGLISVSVNTTGLGPEAPHELWYSKEPTLTPGWLKVSIDRVVGWNASSGSPVDIAVSNFDTPGMRWILRDNAPVHFVPYLAPQSQPGLLITDSQEIPEILNSYRGQDLVWSHEVRWEDMSPFQYLNWMITRDAPITPHEIIFWVRTDLMPDDQFTQ